MWVFAVEPTVFGLVAAVCTLSGTMLAIASHIYGRKNAAEEAAKQVHEDLLAERRRTETLSKQLQELRLKYGEDETNG